MQPSDRMNQKLSVDTRLCEPHSVSQSQTVIERPLDLLLRPSTELLQSMYCDTAFDAPSRG